MILLSVAYLQILELKKTKKHLRMNSTVISQRQNVTRVENTNSESLLSKLSLVDLGKIQHSIYKLN